MKVFVWERVDWATTHFHDEGGVIVFAESLEDARALVRADASIPSKCGVHTVAPTLTVACEETTPRVIVFPDAGCC
jgi:predicted RNase H-like HicB family nuclease